MADDKPKIGVGVKFDGGKVRSERENTITDELPDTVSTDPDAPFQIVVLGDFSGRAVDSQQIDAKISSRRFIEVDRDNFDSVLQSFNINLQLELNNSDSSSSDKPLVVPVKINELDDFHPDELYEKLEIFSKLRSLRRRLKNNKTFTEAATEVQSWLLSADQAVDLDDTQEPETVETQKDANEGAAGSLLDNILETQAQQPNSQRTTEATHIDKLIRSIVAPYVEAAADPRQDDLIATVDRATQAHMRDILHNSHFQSIESAWQSLYFLIKRIETDRKLKIFLLDISKQELETDVCVDDISTSSVYSLFCDKAEGENPWAVMVGNYTFEDSVSDALCLSGIAKIASKAGAPFLAAASETLACCESFSTTPDYEDWNYKPGNGALSAWEMLRNSSDAKYIGLALPRFLLRLPYGDKSKPVDSFEFEEMPEDHCHNCYLWGNAAFIKVELLARNFRKQGWSMKPGEVYQTDNLPLHYYKEDGETVTKAVAEIYLTERGGEMLSANGLMPVWSVKNMDSLRSSDFRSLHASGQLLKGRWA